MNVKFPNFFVIGAAKSGTTSLHRYLDEHPDIHMSCIKEPHFFCRDIQTGNFSEIYRKSVDFDLKTYLARSKREKRHIAHVLQKEDYLSLFRDVRKEKAVGECSTGYLYSEVAAKEIRKAVPHAKIVMVLRNPVERAFSHYLADLRMGTVAAGTFGEALEFDFNRKRKGWGVSSLYVEIGLYYRQVKRYLDVFPEESVKILFFEDFRDDPGKAMSELYAFLGVDRNFTPNLAIRYNSALVPRWRGLFRLIELSGVKRMAKKSLSPGWIEGLRPLMFINGDRLKPTPEEVRYASAFFRDDISLLSELLGKDLSRWSSSPLLRLERISSIKAGAHPHSA